MLGERPRMRDARDDVAPLGAFLRARLAVDIHARERVADPELHLPARARRRHAEPSYGGLEVRGLADGLLDGLVAVLGEELLLGVHDPLGEVALLVLVQAEIDETRDHLADGDDPANIRDGGHRRLHGRALARFVALAQTRADVCQREGRADIGDAVPQLAGQLHRALRDLEGPGQFATFAQLLGPAGEAPNARKDIERAQDLRRNGEALGPRQAMLSLCGEISQAGPLALQGGQDGEVGLDRLLADDGLDGQLMLGANSQFKILAAQRTRGRCRELAPQEFDGLEGIARAVLLGPGGQLDVVGREPARCLAPACRHRLLSQEVRRLLGELEHGQRLPQIAASAPFRFCGGRLGSGGR